MGPKVPEWLPRRVKVKAVANGHVFLGAPGPTIDSVEMDYGDLFLAPRQSDAADNGVYVWTGSRRRAHPVDSQPRMGDEVEAEQGTANMGTRFVNANDNVFVQISEWTPNQPWLEGPARCVQLNPLGSVQCWKYLGHTGAHETTQGELWYVPDASPPLCDQPHPRSPSTRCVLPFAHSGKHGSAMSPYGDARGDVWSTADHLLDQCPAVTYRGGSVQPRCILSARHQGPHVDRTDGSGWIWTTDGSYIRPPRDGVSKGRPRGKGKITLAWHDVTCPDGVVCRKRGLHTLTPMVSSGLLEKFLARMAEMP